MAQVDDRGRRTAPTARQLRGKPKPKPKAAPVGDVKSDADRRRSERYQQTAPFRKAVRDTYKEQAVEQRRAIVHSKAPGPAADEARRVHGGRMETKRQVAAFVKWANSKKKTQPTQDIIEGAGHYRSMRRKATADVGKALVEGGRAITSMHLEAPKQKGPNLGRIALDVKDLAVGGPVGAANVIRRRVTGTTPVDDNQAKLLKGTLDGTSKALEQTNRVASASAGAALAALDDKNVLKGAVEGFKSNDKSYSEVAKRLGLKGPVADVVGLAGDIFLDPSTYLSLGLKAPATAAERAALAATARKVKRAAKTVDRKVAQGALTRDDAEAVLQRMWKEGQEKAAAEAQKLEQAHRGIQVGVRLPGGKTLSTKGRATAKAAEKAAPAAGRAQQNRVVNDILTSFSPAQRPRGVSAQDWKGLRESQREADALEVRISREGTQLARYLQRVTDGDLTKVRAIVDAIEADDLSHLPVKLRQAAERTMRFHDDVASRYEALTGKPLHLAETVYAKGDVAKAAKLADKILGAKKGAAHAVNGDSPEEAIARLREVVEGLRTQVKGKAARKVADEHLGAVRRGDVVDDELAAALEAPRGDRTARATIKARRADLEAQHLAHLESNGGAPLKGKAAKLERQLEQLTAKVGEEAPKNYVPRQLSAFLEDAFARKGEAQSLQGHDILAQAGFEQARLERRRMSTVRQETDRYSEELPLLEARYGTAMGRRLGNLSLYKAIMQRFAAPATMDNLAEGVLFRVAEDGRLSRVQPDELADAGHAIGAGEADDMIVLPAPIADVVEVRLNRPADKHAALEGYDAALRTFKSMNTVLRPGFFATSILGNFWQQFLVDTSPREMARSFRILASLRHGELAATHDAAGLRKAILDRAAPGADYLVDGRRMTFAELFDEGIEYGAVRTGSRIGDPLELTLERQADRQLGGKGKRAVEWLGQLSEDIDDMTRATLYIRGRTQGLDPRQATAFAYTAMIDYGDLTPFERRVMKRVMPFYVYTSRNLPIQIRRTLARPGKLANFEKVRQFLAEEAGLPADWETLLSEGDQERMPFPVPGVKWAGFQHYQYLRLPVEDISRPLQLLQGGAGVKRLGERYAADVVPIGKAPFEVWFNRRFDFDRPIDVPGKPPPAGWLLQHIPGATLDGEYNARTGEKYTGARPWLDYILRTVGGSYGSAALNAGRGVPDRSNIPSGLRAAASILGGEGMNAPDPLDAVYVRLLGERDKLNKHQNDLEGREGRSTPAAIALQDRIDDLNDVITKVKAATGDADARKRVGPLHWQELQRILEPRQSPRIRAITRLLDRSNQQYLP